MPFFDNIPDDGLTTGQEIKVGDLGVRQPKDDPNERSPDFFTEIIPAAFRRENLIGSFITGESTTGESAFKRGVSGGLIDPDFDPFRDLDEKYHPFAQRFTYARDADEVARVKAQIDQEIEDAETLEAGEFGGLIAGLMAGILDPTVIVPGVAIFKVARAGAAAPLWARLLQSGQVGVTAGLAGTAAQEAGLQATQLTRSIEESLINIAAGGVLGGVLGGTAGALGGRAVVGGLVGGTLAGFGAEAIGGEPFVYGAAGAALSAFLARGRGLGRAGIEIPSVERLAERVEEELVVPPDPIPDIREPGSIRVRFDRPTEGGGPARTVEPRVRFGEDVPLSPRPRTRLEDILANITARMRDLEALQLDEVTPGAEVPRITDTPPDFRPTPEELKTARDILRGDVTDSKATRIIQAVKKAGGVHPDSPEAGDLRAAGITSRTVPGLFRRAAPPSLDAAAREALVAEGFFPGRTAEALSDTGVDTGVTTDDIVQAMVRDFGGDPVVADPARLQKRDELVHLQTFLERDIGLNLADFEPRDLAFILRQDEGFQRLAALERRVDQVTDEEALERIALLDREIEKLEIDKLDDLDRLEGFDPELEADDVSDIVGGVARTLDDLVAEDVPLADPDFSLRRASLDDDIRSGEPGRAGRADDPAGALDAGESRLDGPERGDPAAEAAAGEAARSGDAIADDIAAQLERAGTDPDIARTQAALHRGFASGLTARYGISPDEFYGRIMGLRIEGRRRLSQRSLLDDTEIGEQHVLPGAERLTPEEMQALELERRRNARLAGKGEQKPMDEGMFGDEAKQRELFQSALAKLTDTPEFRRFFRESQAIDENGEPLVVYHGTGRDFEAFDIREATDSEGLRHGLGWGPGKFYFADNPGGPSITAEFAPQVGKGDAPNVIPAYVRIENPIDAADFMARVDQKMADGLERVDALRATDAEVRAEGHDGIIDRNSGGLAVYDPTQIKSIFNRGTFDSSDPRILYQGAPVEPAPVFYSAAEQAALALKQEKGPPAQMIGAMQKALGITLLKKGAILTFDGDRFRVTNDQTKFTDAVVMEKINDDGEAIEAAISKQMVLRGNAEELADLDIENAFAGQKSVTKQEIADYIRANKLEIEEVVLGDDGAAGLATFEARNAYRDALIEHHSLDEFDVSDAVAATRRRAMGESQNIPLNPKVRGALASRVAAVQDAARAYQAAIRSMDFVREPKFPEFVLPGGENYREVLLKLPLREGARRGLSPEEQARLDELTDLRVGQSLDGLSPAQQDEYFRLIRQREVGAEGENFTGSHHDDPNVLAHLRLNERVDADGKRMLFVEEIQSDWHQKGRKKGYRTGDAENRARLAELREQVRPFYEGSQIERENLASLDGILGDPLALQTIGVPEQIINDLLDVASRSAAFRDAVPDAPLKKTWHEMSFRRVVRMAAEEGFDRIGWTTGEQQVVRYEEVLRNNIDRIRWEKTEEGIHLVGEKGSDPTGIEVSLDGRDTADTLLVLSEQADPEGFRFTRSGEPQTAGTPEEILIDFMDAEVFRTLGVADGGSARAARGVLTNRQAELIATARHATNPAIAERIEAEALAVQVISRNWEAMSPRYARDTEDVVNTAVAENALSDAVGKAVADDIIASPDQSGVIEGDALRIDDTGMAGFYDKMIPAYANKFGKKYKVKAARGALENPQAGDRLGIYEVAAEDHIELFEAGSGRWRHFDPTAPEGDAFVGPVFDTRAEALAWQRSHWEVRDDVTGEVLAADLPTGQAAQDFIDAQTATIHTFDIPEAMRNDVLQKGVVLYQTAFHGGPHMHTKFSTKFVGTGEGAQVFGWGLYFSSRKGIGEYYREMLTRGQQGPRVTIGGKPWQTFKLDVIRDLAADTDLPHSRVLDREERLSGAVQTLLLDVLPAPHGRGMGVDTVRSRILTMIGHSEKALRENQARGDAEGAAFFEDDIWALRQLENAVFEVDTSKPGRTFKVRLAPEEDEYLLWDKPLSEQSEKVRAALRGAIGNDSAVLNLVQEKSNNNLTGAGIYRALAAAYRDAEIDRGINAKMHDAQREASLALLDAGIRGIKYLDGSSRNRPLKDIKRQFLDALPEDADDAEVMGLVGGGHFTPEQEAVLRALENDDWLGFDFPAQAISAAYSGRAVEFDMSPALIKAVADSQVDGSFNFVIFDDADITIESFWQQGMAQTPRGQIILTPGETVIGLFANADRSTFLHESAHFFVAGLEALEARGIDTAREDLDVLRKFAGDIDADGRIGNQGQEKIARAFERWLREGRAPTRELEGAFQRFAEWLIQIYRHVRALNVELTDDVRKVFARMLGAGDEADQATLDALIHHDQPRIRGREGLLPEEAARMASTRPQAPLTPDTTTVRIGEETLERFAPVANDLGDLAELPALGDGSVGAQQLLVNPAVLGAMDRTLNLDKVLGAGAGAVKRRVLVDGEEIAGRAGTTNDVVATALTTQQGDIGAAADMLEELIAQGAAGQNAGPALERLRSMQARGSRVTFDESFSHNRAGKIGKLLAHPIMRNQTSPSPTTRNAGAKLTESPAFFEGNEYGAASPEAVESLITIWTGQLARALQFQNQAFLRHRGAQTGEGAEALRITGRQIADTFGGPPQGRLSFQAFREEVGRAMRRGDQSAIPEVNEVAKFYRDLFDRMKDDAIDLELLPEGVEVSTALSYLTRVYNIEKIIAQRNRWIDDAVLPWLKGERANAQKRLDEFDAENPQPDEAGLEIRQGLLEFAGADDAELKSVANQITDKILGHADGLIPYEAIKLAPGPRGPLRERTFNIPDEVIEPWLESDIELIASFYVRTMAPDIEITRAFGDPTMKKVFKGIEDDYEALKTRAGHDEKLSADLAYRQAVDVEDMEMMRDRLRGTYAMPADPRAVWYRTLKGIRQFNYLRYLGGMTVSATPDLGRLVGIAGGRMFFGTALDALIPSAKGSIAKMAKGEVQLAGQAWEMVLNSRARSLADVGDRYGRGTRFERGLRAMSDSFSQITLMAPWNDRLKTWAGLIQMSQMLEVSQRFVETGRVSANDLRRMAQIGIDRNMMARIGRQFIEHGATERNIRFANTEAWTDPDAIRAFRVSIAKNVDKVIVTPGVGDLPGWFSDPVLGLAGQFRSFSVASAQRMLFAGIQQRDAATLQGFAVTLMLGAAVYLFKQKLADREISDDPWVWMTEAVDRSGLTGWFFDIHNIVEKWTGMGVNRLVGGADQSRFASRDAVGALAGPTIGTISELQRALRGLGKEFTGDDFRRSDLRALRRLLPFQNLFYIRGLLNEAQDGIAEHFDLPGK